MTLLSKCVEGHQVKNCENEGIRGEHDGVFGGHTGETHPPPSKRSQYQQEEGVLSWDVVSVSSLSQTMSCQHCLCSFSECFHRAGARHHFT